MGSVRLVLAAPISDPDLVASTIAQTLGIRETGGRPLRESLKEELRPKEMLLVLDNFEQLLLVLSGDDGRPTSDDRPPSTRHSVEAAHDGHTDRDQRQDEEQDVDEGERLPGVGPAARVADVDAADRPAGLAAVPAEELEDDQKDARDSGDELALRDAIVVEVDSGSW